MDAWFFHAAGKREGNAKMDKTAYKKEEKLLKWLRRRIDNKNHS